MRALRRGYLLLELGIAAVVLGALMAMVMAIVVQAAAGRRESENRALAAQQAASLLEQCVSLPRNAITREKLAELAQARQADALLPEESVNVSLGGQSADEKGKRIAVEIRWKTPAGNVQGPVRLTTWVFDQPRGVSP